MIDSAAKSSEHQIDDPPLPGAAQPVAEHDATGAPEQRCRYCGDGEDSTEDEGQHHRVGYDLHIGGRCRDRHAPGLGVRQQHRHAGAEACGRLQQARPIARWSDATDFQQSQIR